jgi:IS30 family transposase
VLAGLAHGLSPEQVAGRLARDNGAKLISHETIYRFFYAQLARTNDFSWRHYLPRAKTRRGWRGRKGLSQSKKRRPSDVTEGPRSRLRRDPSR